MARVIISSFLTISFLQKASFLRHWHLRKLLLFAVLTDASPEKITRVARRIAAKATAQERMTTFFIMHAMATIPAPYFRVVIPIPLVTSTVLTAVCMFPALLSRHLAEVGFFAITGNVLHAAAFVMVFAAAQEAPVMALTQTVTHLAGQQGSAAGTVCATALQASHAAIAKLIAESARLH